MEGIFVNVVFGGSVSLGVVGTRMRRMRVHLVK
jgi:hypothetical protein